MFAREIQVKLVGDSTLTGETINYTLNAFEFQTLTRAYELMHLTKGDRTAVSIILEGQYYQDGMWAKGYVDMALAMYKDITNYTVLSIYVED